MSLITVLDIPQEVATQAQVLRVIDKIEIERIMDIPSQKTIIVEVKGFGALLLESVSKDNYNNPPWTDEIIIQAVKSKLGLT